MGATDRPGPARRSIGRSPGDEDQAEVAAFAPPVEPEPPDVDPAPEAELLDDDDDEDVDDDEEEESDEELELSGVEDELELSLEDSEAGDAGLVLDEDPRLSVL